MKCVDCGNDAVCLSDTFDVEFAFCEKCARKRMNSKGELDLDDIREKWKK